MEAQRISLSQIHAAQLELLQESLQAEREAALRSLELQLRASHWREVERLREALDLKGDGSGKEGGGAGTTSQSPAFSLIHH